MSRAATATSTWGDLLDGEVALLRETAEGAEDAEYYSVRNAYHQELGSLDEHGRAWRFVPHQREAEWVGTGTLVEGARKILELGPGADLEEVELVGAEVDARRCSPGEGGQDVVVADAEGDVVVGGQRRRHRRAARALNRTRGSALYDQRESAPPGAAGVGNVSGTCARTQGRGLRPSPGDQLER